jgi:hypothetical protein
MSKLTKKSARRALETMAAEPPAVQAEIKRKVHRKFPDLANARTLMGKGPITAAALAPPRKGSKRKPA